MSGRDDRVRQGSPQRRLQSIDPSHVDAEEQHPKQRGPGTKIRCGVERSEGRRDTSRPSASYAEVCRRAHHCAGGVDQRLLDPGTGQELGCLPQALKCSDGHLG